MDALDSLQLTLGRQTQLSLSRLRAADLLPLKAEQGRLREWLGDVDRKDNDAPETIDAAVAAFVRTGMIKGARQLRLVCHGCAELNEKAGVRLIEDNMLFGRLLDWVTREQPQRRLFRKCYRGLLNSYFSYDPYRVGAPTAGQDNWQRLRQFLGAQLPTLRSPLANPVWVEYLSGQPGLFSEDPTLPYTRALADGNWPDFEHLCEQLGIGDESWLVREIVLIQVRSLTGEDDATLAEYLADILLLLTDHPLHADAGLTLLLDRYADAAPGLLPDSLGEFAVRRWNNPWLPASRGQWLCSERGRVQAASWLKRRLLQTFFSDLSNDAGTRNRRYTFWSLYGEELEGLYFALGQEAYTSEAPVLRRFRQDGRGLILRLTESKQEMHACILQFKHHHVVEFNRGEHVAYFYDTRQGTPPFYLSKGWIEVGALGVEKVSQGTGSAAQSLPLRHQDERGHPWEERFAGELGAGQETLLAFCRETGCQLEQQDRATRIIPPEDAPLDAWSSALLEGWGFALSEVQHGYVRTRD